MSTISAAKSPKVTPQTTQTAFSTNITSVENLDSILKLSRMDILEALKDDWSAISHHFIIAPQ